MKKDSTGVYYQIIMKWFDIKYKIFSLFNKHNSVIEEAKRLREEQRQNVRFGLQLLIENIDKENFEFLKKIAWNEKEYDLFYEIHNMHQDELEVRGE